ncbi:hypothetical protein EW146_g1522 [Bondarzewia mesenterica]|uniref:DRBM domain-containing protein n=1 Tax=Bondarzewia mesenterica TaxID=1095465 RepID=A0A4S4M3J7_9AGAM|nr:hypothetical protein EW146_g1522 [Bondarzewia mesenterica]
MPIENRPTVRLNNCDQGHESAISWIEYDNGQPNATDRWTLTCKIHGVIKGRASAARKADAKEAAARQALQQLGQN